MTASEAIQHALAAAAPHESEQYRPVAVEAGPHHLELRLVRVIGMAERSHSTHVRRDTDDPATFTQQCARAWEWLAQEHRKSRAETGV